MQAQERQSRKNYIGIISDRFEEQRTFETLPKSDRPIKDWLRRLMTVVLDLRGARAVPDSPALAVNG
jgi:hypothetical protein